MDAVCFRLFLINQPRRGRSFRNATDVSAGLHVGNSETRLQRVLFKMAGRLSGKDGKCSDVFH